MSKLTQRKELFPSKDIDLGYYDPNFEIVRSKSNVGGMKYLVPIIKPSKSPSHTQTYTDGFMFENLEKGIEMTMPRNKVRTPDIAKQTGRDDMMYKVTEAYQPCLLPCIGEMAMSCKHCVKKKNFSSLICNIHGSVQKCLEKIEDRAIYY